MIPSKARAPPAHTMGIGGRGLRKGRSFPHAMEPEAPVLDWETFRAPHGAQTHTGHAEQQQGEKVGKFGENPVKFGDTS